MRHTDTEMTITEEGAYFTHGSPEIRGTVAYAGPVGGRGEGWPGGRAGRGEHGRELLLCCPWKRGRVSRHGIGWCEPSVASGAQELTLGGGQLLQVDGSPEREGR